MVATSAKRWMTISSDRFFVHLNITERSLWELEKSIMVIPHDWFLVRFTFLFIFFFYLFSLIIRKKYYGLCFSKIHIMDFVVYKKNFFLISGWSVSSKRNLYILLVYIDTISIYIIILVQHSQCFVKYEVRGIISCYILPFHILSGILAVNIFPAYLIPSAFLMAFCYLCYSIIKTDVP